MCSSVASATLLTMIRLCTSALFALLLTACSREPPGTTANATPETAQVAASAADAATFVRLGMLFTDSDPWMAGAVLIRGQLRVGDHLFLLTRDNHRVPVEIVAIRDENSRVDVPLAEAPGDLFLSFQAAPDQGQEVQASNALLVGDPETRDYAAAMQDAKVTSEE